MNDRNREYLIQAAKLLGPLLNELVFVGGAVTGLLATDSAAGEPRVTIDVVMQLRKFSLCGVLRIWGAVTRAWVFRTYNRRRTGMPLGSAAGNP
jgi:hypothetical protein